jgi:phosphatidyl-myo-inositol dimannoside synthase
MPSTCGGLFDPDARPPTGGTKRAVRTRPRVLLITPDYPPSRGGIQNLLHGIVRHATRVEFRVIARGPGHLTDVGEVRTRWVGGRGGRIGSLAALNLAGVREAQRFRPDVVLSGHIVASPACRAIRAPFVQYLYAEELAHHPRLTAFAVRHAQASIALSGHTRRLALAAGADEARIHDIPPGIDLGPPPVTSRKDGRPLIVSVGRLEDRYKGFDVLIRALPLIRSRVPDATLILVGEGSLRPCLEALASANGCADALRITGGVTDAERDALLREATVFAMPSRVPDGAGGGEGFGIVYLEAGAQGTPVVAGNVGGALDAVIDGQTGVLVTPDDHVEVAGAITELLLDRARAARLGAGGRRWAERFAWPSIVREIEDLLVSVGAGSAESPQTTPS